MPDLVHLIREAMAAGQAGAVESSIFESRSPADVAAGIHAVCAASLGATAVDALFYSSSVGCVAGLTLADGQQVVVKAYQPRWAGRFLELVADTQNRLVSGGFPCPRPLTGPVSAVAGLALVDEYLPDPGPGRISPRSLAVSARGLAHQVELASSLDWSGHPDHPGDPAPGDLFPTPHSPQFDFAATATGADWIDDWAAQAKQARDGGESRHVVGHCDWARRNVRLGEDRLLAVYDMDSLAWVPEPVVVGQAAITWSTVDGSEAAPHAEEVARYVAAYERARGSAFEPAEVAAAGAAALYLLAYAARCEHAVDPDEKRWRRARPRLRSDASALLSLPEILDQLDA